MNKSRNNRYYLHRKVRQQGFRLVSKLRTIYVTASSKDIEITCQLARLVKVYGYAIQTEIPQ